MTKEPIKNETESEIVGLKSFSDIVIPSHMLEIYDFPKAVRTQDLLQVT